MTTHPTVSQVSMLVLACLLIAAVVTDVRSRRIPNRLVLAGLALAAGAQAIALLTDSLALAGPHWWAPLSGMLVGGLLLMPLYLLRSCGAGDVKLMAMAGAFLGGPATANAVVYALLAGGVLSLVFMLVRGVAGQVVRNVRFLLTDWLLRLNSSSSAVALSPLETTAARLPYGVAIAIGAMFALFSPRGFG